MLFICSVERLNSYEIIMLNYPNIDIYKKYHLSIRHAGSIKCPFMGSFMKSLRIP